jgi:hypothetical protein
MEKLPAFRNEPYTDFSDPANRRAMDAALSAVRAQLGREYELLIGGERLKTGDLLRSVSSASASSNSTPGWSTKPARPGRKPKPKRRSHRFLRILRARNGAPRRSAAGGPTARRARRDDLHAAGRRRGDSAMEFPAGDLVGMTVAALVTGNTAIIKPSSETPTIAAKFAEVLLEAGFPARQFHAADGQRRGRRRRAGGAASQDALHLLHRLARRRPAHQRTGREGRSPARSGSSACRRNGRQGRHHRGCRLRSR